MRFQGILFIMLWLNPLRLTQGVSTDGSVSNSQGPELGRRGSPRAYRPFCVYGYVGRVVRNLGGHNIWAGPTTGSSLVLELPGYLCFKASRFIWEWEWAELKWPQLWKVKNVRGQEMIALILQKLSPKDWAMVVTPDSEVGWLWWEGMSHFRKMVS